MDKKRILLGVGWYFPESTGGSEIYVAELARALREYGHEVAIAVPSSGVTETAQSFYDGAAVYRYPIPVDASRDECQSRVRPRFFDRYETLLETFQPDIVHFHTVSWAMGVHHLRAARGRGCGTYATFHTPGLGYLCPRGTGMIWGKEVCDGIVKARRCSACLAEAKGIPRPFAQMASAIPGPVGERLRVIAGKARWGTLAALPDFVQNNLLLQSALFDSIDMAVSLTGWGERILLSNGCPKKKILICKLAVSSLGAIQNKKGGDITVGFVGRMDPIKGLHVLLDAFARLPETPILLKIYSIQNHASDYAAMIRSRVQHDKRIELLPALAHSDISKAFEQIDILAVPSLCMEGGPTILLESFAHGVPVLGSNIGAIPEYVRHNINGLLTAPNDVDDLKGALSKLAGNSHLIESLRRNIVAPSTMKDVAGSMLEIYASRLGAAKKP